MLKINIFVQDVWRRKLESQNFGNISTHHETRNDNWNYGACGLIIENSNSVYLSGFCVPGVNIPVSRSGQGTWVLSSVLSGEFLDSLQRVHYRFLSIGYNISAITYLSLYFLSNFFLLSFHFSLSLIWLLCDHNQFL